MDGLLAVASLQGIIVVVYKIPLKGSKIKIQVRLQRPLVDIEKCIGCGVCQHECPVSGRKAIRVSAEGETRNTASRLLIKPR